jgi:hypothetical protein
VGRDLTEVVEGYTGNSTRRPLDEASMEGRGCGEFLLVFFLGLNLLLLLQYLRGLLGRWWHQ